MRSGRSPDTTLWTSPESSVRFSVPEQTKPPGSASTSTRKPAEARSSSGSSDGTTGRSFTTESSPFPWMRRPRTTTPSLSRARSGVSKKKTWRICASSGSRPSATTAERWSYSGTVSFSSTLSESLSRSSISAICSCERATGVAVGVVVIVSSLGQGCSSMPSFATPARRSALLPPPEARGRAGWRARSARRLRARRAG